MLFFLASVVNLNREKSEPDNSILLPVYYIEVLLDLCLYSELLLM